MSLKKRLALFIATAVFCAGCATNMQQAPRSKTVTDATAKEDSKVEAGPAAEAPENDRLNAYRRPEGSGNPYAGQLTDSEFDKRVGKVLEQWNISPAGAQALVKLETLDLNKGLTRDEMVRMFGEPHLLSNGGYQYPWGFIFYFENEVAREVRFEVAPFFAYAGKIRVGSTIDEVEKFLKPARVVTGYSPNLDDGVLYKDRDGIKGLAWYQDKQRGIIIGMSQNEVTSLSLMRRDAFK